LVSISGKDLEFNLESLRNVKTLCLIINTIITKLNVDTKLLSLEKHVYTMIKELFYGNCTEVPLVKDEIQRANSQAELSNPKDQNMFHSLSNSHSLNTGLTLNSEKHDKKHLNLNNNIHERKDSLNKEKDTNLKKDLVDPLSLF